MTSSLNSLFFISTFLSCTFHFQKQFPKPLEHISHNTKSEKLALQFFPHFGHQLPILNILLFHIFKRQSRSRFRFFLPCNVAVFSFFRVQCVTSHFTCQNRFSFFPRTTLVPRRCRSNSWLPNFVMQVSQHQKTLDRNLTPLALVASSFIISVPRQRRRRADLVGRLVKIDYRPPFEKEIISTGRRRSHAVHWMPSFSFTSLQGICLLRRTYVTAFTWSWSGSPCKEQGQRGSSKFWVSCPLSSEASPPLSRGTIRNERSICDIPDLPSISTRGILWNYNCQIVDHLTSFQG